MPIVFSFFARMNLLLARKLLPEGLSAYCFQFFRADEQNPALINIYTRSSAYCFQFFRADELRYC